VNFACPYSCFYSEYPWGYCAPKEGTLPTAIFALLRKDHIVFASDSLHVRGDENGRYKNERAFKVQNILENTALLGFAGEDECEEVILRLKRNGRLERGSLRDVAEAVEKQARELYGKQLMEGRGPRLEFLLAGFEAENGTRIATAMRIGGRLLNILTRSYDPQCDNFEIIGVSPHGAFYTLRKCAADCLTLELGIQLACFTLMEVGKYEIRVGGEPQIFIIRPDQKIENISDNLEAHKEWASDVGERIRTMIVAPMKRVPLT
jgi:20S proteasome alpha/beta subunit